MARTTVSDVRDVLDVDTTTLSDSEIQAYMDDANVVVTGRLGDHVSDADTLERIEKYVAAHFAYGEVLGDEGGRVVSSVADGESEVTYETADSADGGSPHWDRAVLLDPTSPSRLKHRVRSASSRTTGE